MEKQVVCIAIEKPKQHIFKNINFKSTLASNHSLYMIARTHFALKIPFLIKLLIQPIEVSRKHVFPIKHSTVNEVVK